MVAGAAGGFEVQGAGNKEIQMVDAITAPKAFRKNPFERCFVFLFSR
jgi:hypothetical protein